MPWSTCIVLLTLFTASLGLLLFPANAPTGALLPTAHAAAAFNVNSTGDGADSDLSDNVCNDGSGQCTLRAAVQQANQLAGADTINVNVTGTISLTSALPRLSGMTIIGPGSTLLSVRRDPGAATSFRIFTTELSTTVSISGLTVTGGRSLEDGGGIYNEQNASLSLSDVVVTDNATASLVDVSAGHGGGIYHDGTSLTLTNCTVSNNSTVNFTGGPDGGGIYAGDGTVNITNSTVNGNRAGTDGFTGPGNGGGIYIESGVSATLTNSTVSGNSTGTNNIPRPRSSFPLGGGIFNAGNLTLNSCTVVGNTANGGGGISNNASSLNTANLRNTIVANNTSGTNPDLFGTYNSQDFNLIRTPRGATINGTTTHNVTGVDPLLGPLQNNGGPTRTHALLAGSPAIDAGDGGGLTTDQRGLTRPVDSVAAANASDGADIGAFEAQAAPPGGQIQFGAASYTADEGAGGATVTVTRTGGSTGAVSVTFATADGTAKAGADYPAVSNFTVTFADGDTASKTVNVPVTDDLLDEPDETVVLTLSNPTGGATLVGTPTTATLNIADNDAAPSASVNDVTVTEGDAGRTPANFVISLSGPSGKTVSVSYFPSDGTATAHGAEYDFEQGGHQVTFVPGETSKTVTVRVRGDARVEPDETFFLHLGDLPVNATISDGTGVGTILNDDSPATKSVQFGDYQFQTAEGPSAMAITLYRVGDLSAAASVDYATSDGTATDRGDYTTAFGRATFPAGSDSALFDVFITDDRFHEGDETFTLTLSNPSGVTLGAGSTTTVIISDDDPADGPSPVAFGPSFDVSFFVRQHYRDFLGRNPDSSGFQFWTDEINSCGADAQCKEVKRVNVSAAFFLSIEFQQTGYLSHRARKAAFGNLAGKSVPLTREEMLRDQAVLGAGLIVGATGWDQKLEGNKQAYFAQLVASARFTTLYPQTLTPEQFVDALNANAGGALSQAERDALVNDLRNGAKTRAQILRAVAEDADLSNAELNKAFVLMQYIGYLRRDPDASPDTSFDGYNHWLGKLQEFNGNYIQAEMVKAFIDSIEYRNRFGQ
ncbi:MAG TPA: Calx-beta domain-containing protein [Pyrinomonadaceae bacterium]|nr:Calx-beta domain-containing protein [Pyrinomonadaceae bacterium]